VNEQMMSWLARLEQAQGNAYLVNLGLACLSRTEIQMVVAFTKMLWREGRQHA
jgi:hypothetical protein